MLEIKNLSKTYGGIKAVNDCSFCVEEGSITALIGPNGAGKSTTFELICGNEKPDEGKVLFLENDISKLSIHLRAKKGISRTFQAVRIFKNLTLGDSMNLAVEKGDDSFFGMFNRLSHRHEMEETLAEIGLDKPLNSLVSELSYGQQKLFSLAVSFIFPHNILLLDEPVAGVNPVLREKITNILRERNKEKNETILIIEHDIEFVRNLADTVIVMDAGKVITQGSPHEVLNDKKVLEAYLGEQV